MAALGTALMSTLSHTDQEKMFRPWWDNLEDFVIYGLISLGLIVLPTQIFQGTPLFCTICTTVSPHNEQWTKSGGEGDINSFLCHLVVLCAV